MWCAGVCVYTVGLQMSISLSYLIQPAYTLSNCTVCYSFCLSENESVSKVTKCYSVLTCPRLVGHENNVYV